MVLCSSNCVLCKQAKILVQKQCFHCDPCSSSLYIWQICFLSAVWGPLTYLLTMTGLFLPGGYKSWTGGHPAGLEKGWCMWLPPLLSRSFSYHLFFCSGASQLPSVSSFPFDLPHRKNQWQTLKSNRSLETRVCYSFIQAVLGHCMPTNTEAISLTIHFSVVIW